MSCRSVWFVEEDLDRNQLSNGASVRCDPPGLKYKHKRTRHNFISTLLETIYEKCVFYNLRHCSYRRHRGFVCKRNYFTNTLKDSAILCFFLLANLIVFLTMLTRIIIQFAYFVVGFIKSKVTKRDSLEVSHVLVLTYPKPEADTKKYIKLT